MSVSALVRFVSQHLLMASPSIFIIARASGRLIDIGRFGVATVAPILMMLWLLGTAVAVNDWGCTFEQSVFDWRIQVGALRTMGDEPPDDPGTLDLDRCLQVTG